MFTYNFWGYRRNPIGSVRQNYGLSDCNCAAILQDCLRAVPFSCDYYKYIGCLACFRRV